MSRNFGGVRSTLVNGMGERETRTHICDSRFEQMSVYQMSDNDTNLSSRYHLHARSKAPQENLTFPLRPLALRDYSQLMSVGEPTMKRCLAVLVDVNIELYVQVRK